MSTTRNIMSSVLFSRPFLNYQPVDISQGEPAVSSANLTRQTMLSPPFSWPYNRNNFHIELDPGAGPWGQDYMISIPDFHFVEKVWLTDPDSGKVNEITNLTQTRSLGAESAIQRPSSASMNLMDNTGLVTLRLNTLPDKPYVIDGFYQRAPLDMTSLASMWAPIPDHHRYIYDWGFLGFVALLTKDSRAAGYLGKFTSHLLGAQDGLTALQRNIFMGSFLELLTQQGRETMTTQQGVQSRGNT